MPSQQYRHREPIIEIGSQGNGEKQIRLLILGDSAAAGVGKNQWMASQKELVCLLREKFKVKRLLISAPPPMEMFPALPWPLGFYLGLCSSQMNRSMRVWLATQADCEFLEFNLPFDEGLMAEDGFHPGPKLHTFWEREIFGRINQHFSR